MRIMLACAAGMSTSILVARMEEASKAQGREDTIWAVEQGTIADEIGNFDVLLLGPQVRFIKKKVRRSLMVVLLLMLSIQLLMAVAMAQKYLSRQIRYTPLLTLNRLF